jgi:hypothetical protein
VEEVGVDRVHVEWEVGRTGISKKTESNNPLHISFLWEGKSIE